HYLLTHKNIVVEAVRIERTCNEKETGEKPPADESVSFGDGFHAGEMDLSRLNRGDFSLATVKAQKTVWQQQLEQETDPSERADLLDKIDKATNYISHNENIHGRARPEGPLEEARKRVSNNINRAKRSITAANKHIGAHFQVFVKPRGTAFVYVPDRETDWTL
ncbi:MAG: hypothetical protein JSW27_19975, partial [Phycisphaerales bacterium]